MLGWACSFEHLKRRSMARPGRVSSSISAMHSRVADALRFLPAASERVVSRRWLMTVRFRSRSFCSRGIIGFLFGLQNVGDVIGAESAGGGGLLDGAGHGVQTILANELKQFRDLARQGAIAVSNVA